MSEHFSTLVVLAAQVTLPVVAALLLARNRSPVAASRTMFMASVAVAGLTVIALLPRPLWPEPPRAVTVSMRAESAQQAVQASGGLDITELLRQVRPLRPRVAPASPGIEWERLVVWSILGLAGLGLVRLTIGWCHTVRLVSTARRIDDINLRDEVRSLAEAMGVRRPVAVRELSGVGPGAAFGCWRPVVLLAPTWRLWQTEQRRAVLAHELAHIARRDLPVRLFVRLVAAIHAYHPCFRWLRDRLDLTQELSADQLAARQCGGSANYLRSLASLALLANASRAGTLPAFLSRPRALLTRIAMLRVKEGARRSDRRWPVACVMGTLTAVALLLQGQAPEIHAGPVIRVKAEEEIKLAPLDASYILPGDDEGDVGIAVVRFADLAGRKEIKGGPGGEPLGQLLDSMLPTMFGKDKKVRFKCADIEQVGGRVRLSHDPDKPKPNRSLSLSLVSVRATRDFDWPNQMKDLCDDWQEHTHNGKKYYSGRIEGIVLPSIFRAYFYQPDSRTLILESESNVQSLIDAGKKRSQPWGWERVENGVIGIALQSPDRRGRKLLQLDKDDQSTSPETAATLKAISTCYIGCESAVLGLLPGKTTSIVMVAKYDTPASAKKAIEVSEPLNKRVGELKLPGRSPTAQVRLTKPAEMEVTFEWPMSFSQFLETIPWQ